MTTPISFAGKRNLNALIRWMQVFDHAALTADRKPIKHYDRRGRCFCLAEHHRSIWLCLLAGAALNGFLPENDEADVAEVMLPVQELASLLGYRFVGMGV
jgi:hypothetical protein